MRIESKIQKRVKRKRRIRSKVSGTTEMPRLTVFRSNNHIYAQIIDDSTGKTLVSSSDVKLKGSKVEKATATGKDVATSAKSKKITKVVFDRNGYKYHGRVKALAEGAREGGLQF